MIRSVIVVVALFAGAAAGRLFRRPELESLRAGIKAMPDIRVNDWQR